MGVKAFRYAAPGWGVGEVWLDGERVVWHEAPRSGIDPGGGRSHPLADRFVAYFAGEPVTFDDVEIDLEEYSDFHRLLALELRRVPLARPRRSFYVSSCRRSGPCSWITPVGALVAPDV